MKINFCHQSYLDFLIAQNVVESIENGGSILEWLGTKENQTLFRREQLRQALNMLMIEEIDDFIKIAKEILLSQSVRFHLKHLVLEVIGHTNEFEPGMDQLLIDLVKDSYWNQHALETVFTGNPSAVDLLVKNGLIEKWLASKKETEVNKAIGMLGSLNSTFSQKCINIIEKLANGEEKLKAKALQIIGWHVEEDPDQVFEIRLKLARSQVYHHFINWARLCKINPLRTIKFLKSLLVSIEDPDILNEKGRKNRVEEWYQNDIDILLSMTQKNYNDIWRLILPELNRLFQNKKDSYRKPRIRYGNYNFVEGALLLVTDAAKEIAKRNPDFFVDQSKKILEGNSEVIHEIIFQSIPYLDKKHADFGIRIFLDHVEELLNNYAFENEKYKYARDIINKHSVHCSNKLFSKLEEFITHYHHPNELRLAKYYSEHRKQGQYLPPPFWGREQYLLLSALSKSRINKKTKELLRVLRRRYRGQSAHEIAKNVSGGRGGFVGSKLDDNLHKLGDSTWLEIVTNKKVPVEAHFKWEEKKDGKILESSIGQFASSLEKSAKQNPERFGALALRFPTDVPLSYVRAIMRAFELKESETKNFEKWRPASKELIIQVLDSYMKKNKMELAMEFCRLISIRDDIEWPEHVIEMLKSIAISHSDPKTNSMNIYPSEWDGEMDTLSTDDLLTNSINCVRGEAINAIRDLLFRKPELMNTFQSTIERVVNDPHPSVRVSVTGLLLPVINVDKGNAVRWFVQTTLDDLRVITKSYGIQFFNYTISSYSKTLKPILDNMIKSKDESVVKLGSKMITAYYIIYDLFEEQAYACLKGTTFQKRGAVEAAGELIVKQDYSTKCVKLLGPMIENYDQELIDEMSEVFRHDLNELKNVMEFIIKFIHSPYMKKSSQLIYQLDDYDGELSEFSDLIINLCYEISSNYASETRDMGSEYSIVGEQLPNILLRMYDESLKTNNKTLKDKCLDIWDTFFEKRIGSVRELTNAADTN